jgi:hypothetical protein
MKYDILIMGSGSVTETTCRALALMSPVPMRIVVLGRSRPWVEKLVALANAMSGAMATRQTFIGDTIDWDSDTDLDEKMANYPARLIFQTASLQTPWDFLGAAPETRWKQFVWAAGNAVVVPLQVALVKRVAIIAKAMTPAPVIVNACFPDHVNPILKYLQLPIACGIGNVAMFAGCLKSRYPQPEHKVQIIGHLYHYFKILGKTHKPELDGPRVWIDGKEIQDVENTLRDSFYDLRSVNSLGKIINELVGTVSAEVLLALLGDTPVYTHVPGANGLPGGYPVKIYSGRVELDLPADCTEAEAIALNAQGAYDMGTAVINAEGFSAYSTTATEALQELIPSLAQGFQIAELDAICKQLLDLRVVMEKQPPDPNIIVTYDH